MSKHIVVSAPTDPKFGKTYKATPMFAEVIDAKNGQVQYSWRVYVGKDRKKQVKEEAPKKKRVFHFKGKKGKKGKTIEVDL